MLQTGQNLKTEKHAQSSDLIAGLYLPKNSPASRLYPLGLGLATLAALIAVVLTWLAANNAFPLSLVIQVVTAVLVLAFTVFGDQLTARNHLTQRNWEIAAIVVAAIVLVAAFFGGEFLTVLLVPLLVSYAQRRREQAQMFKVALAICALILLELILLVATNFKLGDSANTTNQQQGAVAIIIVVCSIVLSLAALITNYQTEINNYREEQESKASEMEVAHEIQTSLMPPGEIVAGPWSISAKSIPARDVGGDFYEYIPHLDRSIGGIAIGDVAGKGIPAALQMAVVRTLFRVEARRRIFPAETLMSVNSALQAERSFGMVTLLYGFIDPKTSTLHVSNAGHNYPIILGKTMEEVRLPGLPLGIDDAIEYDEAEVYIPPGTSIIFYTDGVIEAMDAQGEMYGFSRLKEAVEKFKDCEPQEMVNHILNDVSAFTEGAPQSDDITVVVIQRDPTDAELKFDSSSEILSGMALEREKVAMASAADGVASEDFEEGNWI